MNLKKIISHSVIIGLFSSAISVLGFAEIEEAKWRPEAVTPREFENMGILCSGAKNEKRFELSAEEIDRINEFYESYQELQTIAKGTRKLAQEVLIILAKKYTEQSKQSEKVASKARQIENHEIAIRDPDGLRRYIMKKKGLNNEEAIRFMEHGDYFEFSKYVNMFAEEKRKEWAKSKTNKTKKNR